MTQLYFYSFFVISECYVLMSMAYDRYVAICNPLLYNVAMSPKICSYLMLGSYLMAFSGAMAHTGCMLRLTFCDTNTINHYFCDILPVMQLSCTSTYVNELEVFIVAGINIIVPSITIFVSYGFIVSSICRINSAEGRSKAFSTCSSHIIAVSLFFGSAMAYDRYVAICNPLLYNIVMSPKMCSYLMLASYLMGFSGAMIHTGCVLRLTFCNGNTINHYFCDLLPLLQLSCTSTYVNEIELFIVAGKDIIVPTVIIFTSYGFILSSILKINSTEGRSKAFSTCSSHIIAVSLFFGSCAFMYLKPSSAGSMDQGKISSVFYNIVVPMMNPLIYSLRNKDVKIALKKTLSKRKF
ncbi:hypothetical protein STEG23_037470 [Scotinomys teguina]